MAASGAFTGLKRVDAAAVSALNLDPIDDLTRKQALDIVQSVKAGGEAALVDIAVKFKDLAEGAQCFARYKLSADSVRFRAA